MPRTKEGLSLNDRSWLTKQKSQLKDYEDVFGSLVHSAKRQLMFEPLALRKWIWMWLMGSHALDPAEVQSVLKVFFIQTPIWCLKRHLEDPWEKRGWIQNCISSLTVHYTSPHKEVLHFTDQTFRLCQLCDKSVSSFPLRYSVCRWTKMRKMVSKQCWEARNHLTAKWSGHARSLSWALRLPQPAGVCQRLRPHMVTDVRIKYTDIIRSIRC